jgi:uncharacterized membrane protein YbhN (UPF0104 family)
LRSFAKRFLRLAFVALAVGFCAYAVAARWDETSRALADVSWPIVGLAVAAALAGMWALMMGLHATLAGFGSPVPLRGSIRIWFLSQLGKYLPGKVWVLAAQVEMGREYRVPKKRMVSAMLLAMAITVATGLAVAAVTLPLTSPEATATYWWLFLLAPFLIAGLHPRVVTWSLNLALRFVRRPPLERPADLVSTLRALGWNVVGWALFGLHIWLLAMAAGGSGSSLPFAATGAFALAWTVGFLVFFAPGGIGAREAALTVALVGVLPAGAPIIVALVSRVVFTLVDLIGAGTALLLGGRPRLSSTPEPVPTEPAASSRP